MRKRIIYLAGILCCSGFISMQAQTLVAIEENNRYGYADSLGNVRIPCEYPHVFTDTLRTIAFVVHDGRIKAIDSSNNRLFTVFNYDNGPDYEVEGLFRIVDDESNRLGFADRCGRIIIQPAYFFVQPFSEGMAAFNEGGRKEEVSGSDSHIRIAGGKWGYIDKQGAVVFPAIFDEAAPFQNQQAAVKIGARYFMISKQRRSK